MAATDIAPINELVNLLADFAPDRLERLREQSPPSMRPLLVKGGLAGKTDPLVGPRAQATVVALDVAIERASHILPALRSRIRLMTRLRFASEAVALVGSSSVLATLAAGWPLGSIIFGVVALSGSLASLASDHLGKTRNAVGSIPDLYTELVRIQYAGTQLRGELGLHLEIGIDHTREGIVNELIAKSNILAGQVNELSAVLS